MELADQLGTETRPGRVHYRIVSLFLVSGAAALIYQVCWQRLLYESVGVDIQSVTIIVSTFMLGLGAGSLMGGELVDRYPERALELFVLIELATAAFGACSPMLIHAVSKATVNASLAVTVAANFGLLLFQTALIGGNASDPGKAHRALVSKHRCIGRYAVFRQYPRSCLRCRSCRLRGALLSRTHANHLP